jgi:hypothetical protein
MVANYLSDVLNELIDEAELVKTTAKSEIDEGRLITYYQVISKLLNRAEAFGLAENLPGHVRAYRVEDLLNK